MPLQRWGRHLSRRLAHSSAGMDGASASHLSVDPTIVRPMDRSGMYKFASQRMAVVEPSVFAEFTELAARHNAINLGAGFPNYPIPDFVKESAVEAVRNDFNQYTRPAGHPDLVKVLSDYYSPLFNKEINPFTEVAIVGGATNAIFSAVMALVDPGDEVVCIEPYFDAPKIAADLMGATTIGVPLRADWARTSADWKLDIEELRASLTDKTKLLVLNTPHNPTGKVFTRQELEAIAELVLAHPKLVVMTDEVYEMMVYGGNTHERIASLPGMFDRCLSVYSAGKTFSATGWRVGYVFGPAPLIMPMVRVHQASNFCTPTVLQVATARAFTRAVETDYFTKLSKAMEEKRDRLAALLRLAALEPIIPEGGYFMLCDTTKVALQHPHPLWKAPKDLPLSERRDFAVCRLLTERAGVTAIPASAFFSPEHRHITDSLARFCFCKTDETLEAAFHRIVRSGLSGQWV
eukprot:Sspe_Gene.102022::Locus_76714_Transcript_1_1_Confidence_1.000_Length_1552::g.102022::m.102022/K00816/CCBL; kynurenine---oxoglutarate transaminase / cysteine-S-conjugate beta-lyase / glutamine---phenylpyruvate transaminase